MRYIIRTEDEQLEDILADEELTILHRYTHVPYTSIETEMDYEQLRTRYPEYEITPDKHYDTQDPRQDDKERE